MIEIVLGGLLDPPPNAQYAYSTCRGEPTGIGFEMPPEASLAVLAMAAREMAPLPLLKHTAELAQCGAPLCYIFRYADYSDLRLDPGLWRLRAPWVDPAGLIVAVALAFYLEDRLGGGWYVEVYSDAWPRHSDVLAGLEGLQGVLRIYTSAFDPRAAVADRVELAEQSLTYDSLTRLRSWRRRTPLCRATAVEPVEISKGVLELLRTLWNSGGVVTLKYAMEHHQDALVEAVNAGLVAVDYMAYQVRITDRGIAVLRKYGVVGKRDAGGDTNKEPQE